MSTMDDDWHALGFAEKQARAAKYVCSHGVACGYWCEACAIHCRVKDLPYHGIASAPPIFDRPEIQS